MKDMSWFEAMEARIPKGEVRTRFAPSPTGYMHVGNLRTALYTYLIARRAGGKFILRIEDTDQERLVEGAVDVIYKTMSECGLSHDEGPDVGGPVGPYVQTERRSLYMDYAELLMERGHAYRCFCEKTEEPAEGFKPLPQPVEGRVRRQSRRGRALCHPPAHPARGQHDLPRRDLRRHHRPQRRPRRPGPHEARRPAHL